jgi:hypothetical protein
MADSFRRHVDADARASSARCAIAALLPLDLYPAHKRELLSICLWKLSEADGLSKYLTRFCSREALEADRSELAHEHVFERKKLVEQLIAGTASVEEVAGCAVGCTVTRKEHARLSAISRRRPELDGWDRYRAARVRVIDTLTGEPLDAAT